MKIPALLAALTITWTLPVSAQAPPANSGQAPGKVADQEVKTPFWDCTLPGGSYTVLLSKISVVSLHEFNLPGGRVTEMNIVTEGDALARFYFMEPMPLASALGAADAAKARLTELADAAADRTGTEKIWRKVLKDYPLATHAHTIEFRLQTKAELLALHVSAKTAWMRGVGRTVKIADE